MWTIAELLGDKYLRLDIVDVGAMHLGVDEPYADLVKTGHARVIGFEPSARECDILNQKSQGDSVCLPYFIGNGEQRTFHHTVHSMASSFYRPNTKFLQCFQNLEEFIRLDRTEAVETTRLDTLDEVCDVDLLKVDVNGAELEVFEGAHRALSDAVIVQTEAHMVHLYEGAPLFSDVDRELRRHGLMFHTFLGHSSRSYIPMYVPGKPYEGVNQWLWTDAVYVKRLDTGEPLPPEKLISMAAILHEVYGSYDLSAFVLHYHDALTGGDLGMRYSQRMSMSEGA